MSRFFAIGDIHGGLKALEQIMERACIQTSDKLIFLGDYVDGWSESPQVLDMLIAMKTTHNCIFLRGNHDQLLLEWLSGRNENIDEAMWFKHGGQATVDAYKNISPLTIEKHIAFLEQLNDYHIDSQNRLFVHAGFTNMNGVAFEYFPKMFYWERTLWETALALDPLIKPESRFYPKRLLLYKEIFIGHTPVTRIGETIPVNRGCVWNIDTGAAFKGPLTVINVETKAYFQSDPLPELYPGHKGRN